MGSEPTMARGRLSVLSAPPLELWTGRTMEAKNYKARNVLTRSQSCLRKLLALLCFGFFSHVTIIPILRGVREPIPCGVRERLRQSCRWVCGCLGMTDVPGPSRADYAPH